MAAQGRFIGGIRFGVSMDTKKLNSDVKKSRMLIKGFTGQATRMLGVFTGAAGVTGVLLKAGQSYEALNKSMNRSLAIMGDVSQAMREDMRKAAIDLSAEVNASTSQIADSFFFLASAGLNAEQSLAALPNVAKFAQAGNFDMALATDLLTDAQSALGLTVDDTAQNIENMTRVSDVLVKANTVANASVQQFSEALTGQAGPALRSLGKDIEEGLAVLAVFADQGIKGQEASTKLAIVLRDLQTKAIKFPDAFKKAGIAVHDTNGEMLSMVEITKDLERNMIGLSDQAKKTLLLNLGFSDKSVSALQALLGTSAKMQKNLNEFYAAAGTTHEVAGKQLTSLEKATNKLSASFQRLSENMAPIVEKMAEAAELAASLTSGPTPSDNRNLINKVNDEFFGGTPKGSAADKFSTGLREFLRGRNIIRQQNLGFDPNTPGGVNTGYNTPQDVIRRDIERGNEIAQAIVKELPSAFNAAKNFIGEQLANRKGQEKTTSNLLSGVSDIAKRGYQKASAAVGRAQLGILGARIKFAQLQAQYEPKKKKDFGVGDGGGRLAFAEAGSVEAYRQNARIRAEKHRSKLAMQSLREQKKTNQHLAKMSNQKEARI